MDVSAASSKETQDGGRSGEDEVNIEARRMRTELLKGPMIRVKIGPTESGASLKGSPRVLSGFNIRLK